MYFQTVNFKSVVRPTGSLDYSISITHSLNAEMRKMLQIQGIGQCPHPFSGSRVLCSLCRAKHNAALVAIADSNPIPSKVT